MYYCGGTLAGPFYEYKDFMNFMELKDEFKNIPNTFLPTIKRFSTAMFFIMTSKIIDGYFNPSYMLTEEFGYRNFFFKCFFVIMCGNAKIQTYFGAFCLIDCASYASGFMFNGYDENNKVKWNRVEVVRIYDILTSIRIKDYLDAWNISVHKWLKYYVFLRVVKKG